MVLEVFFGEQFYAHKPWFDHPENPNRLRLLVNSLIKYSIVSEGAFNKPEPLEDLDVLKKVHYEGYVRYVIDLCRRAPAFIDPDTYVSKGTIEAVKYSIGSCISGARRIMDWGGTVLILCRPPGHHAGRGGKAFNASSNGFCIFNNIAFSVEEVLERIGGGDRLLVLDFDVHYGNGTQEIYYRDPRVIHVDIHQDPRTLYPYTGYPWMTGSGKGRGSKINIIVPPGSGDDVYLEAIGISEEVIEHFTPEVILVSAGFDAYRGDGLADLRLTSNSYYRLGRIIRKHSKRVLVALEGGYSTGLTRGAPAFIAGLIGAGNPVVEEETSSAKRVFSEFNENARILRMEISYLS